VGVPAIEIGGYRQYSGALTPRKEQVVPFSVGKWCGRYSFFHSHAVTNPFSQRLASLAGLNWQTDTLWLAKGEPPTVSLTASSNR